MTETRLNEILDKQLVKFFGQMVRYIDGRFEEQDARMNNCFDSLERILDRTVKRVEDTEDDKVVTDVQLRRHEKWIGQLSKNTGTKLMPK